MSLSMYDVCIPTLTRALTNLSSFLGKGAEYVEAHNLDPKALPNFRLYPDMLPLKWQVYIATDTAKFSVSRLGEVEAPKFEDTQETFSELKDRVEAVLTFLREVKPEDINGTEDKEVVLKRKSGDLKYSGQQYLLGYALPNLFFHVTTAYDILRHNGVTLGKADFLGKI